MSWLLQHGSDTISKTRYKNRNSLYEGSLIFRLLLISCELTPSTHKRYISSSSFTVYFLEYTISSGFRVIPNSNVLVHVDAVKTGSETIIDKIRLIASETEAIQ